MFDNIDTWAVGVVFSSSSMFGGLVGVGGVAVGEGATVRTTLPSPTASTSSADGTSTFGLKEKKLVEPDILIRVTRLGEILPFGLPLKRPDRKFWGENMICCWYS